MRMIAMKKFGLARVAFVVMALMSMGEAYRNYIPPDMLANSSEAIVIAKISSIESGKKVKLDDGNYTESIGEFVVLNSIKGPLKKGEKISLKSYKGDSYYHDDYMRLPPIDAIAILSLKKKKDGEWVSSSHAQGLSLFEKDQPSQAEIERVVKQIQDAMKPKYKGCKPLVELQRDICYGTCPEYSVTLCEDGQVIYIGKSHVDTIGESRWYIEPKRVEELLATLRESGYLSLRDDYTFISMTDHPSYYLSITIDGKSKYISHYSGDESAPKILSILEERVDEITLRSKRIKKPSKENYRWMSE